MADDSIGTFATMLFEPGASPHVFDALSERYQLLFEDLIKYDRIVGSNGITGTRSHASERTRRSSFPVRGRIILEMSPLDCVTLLPKITGGTFAATAIALAESIPAFGVLLAKDYGVFETKDCYIDKAIIECKAITAGEDDEPDIVRVTLFIVAKNQVTATVWPGTAPALSTAASVAPYVFPDLTLTVQGVARECLGYRFIFDNHLLVRFSNSLTATSIRPTDRTVQLQAFFPWNSVQDDLYEQTLAGAAGTMAHAFSAMSTTFTFGTLQSPDRTPTVRGKTNIILECTMTARTLGATKEWVGDNDSTP